MYLKKRGKPQRGCPLEDELACARTATARFATSSSTSRWSCLARMCSSALVHEAAETRQALSRTRMDCQEAQGSWRYAELVTNKGVKRTTLAHCTGSHCLVNVDVGFEYLADLKVPAGGLLPPSTSAQTFSQESGMIRKCLLSGSHLLVF